MVAITKCPICGKDYRLEKYDVKGRVKFIYIPDCTCADIKFNQISSRIKEDISRRVLPDVFQFNTLPPLYEKYTFEDLDNQKTVEVLKNFARRFKKGMRGGFAFIGETGRGKSVLLACVCKELYKLGFSFLFVRTSELIDRFVDSLDFSAKYKPEVLFKALREIDFIVLDDFGIGCSGPCRQDFLFRVIDELAAYEKCVSLTANPHILSKMKAQAFNEQIFDRLAVLCPYKFVFKGASFRRDSEKNFFDHIQMCEGD